MEPNKSSEKSKLFKIEVISVNVDGKRFPVMTNAMEVTNAININPIEGGSFKYLKLR